MMSTPRRQRKDGTSVPGTGRHLSRDELPPAYFRASILLLVGIVLLFAGFIPLIVLPGVGLPGLAALNWSLGALIAIGSGLAARSIHRMARVFDRARAANWTLCPNCLYDLRDHDEEGECPECGRPFTRLGVQSCWINAHAFHTRYRE